MSEVRANLASVDQSEGSFRMIVNVTTASGAKYEFNHEAMTWSRYHESIDIYGLGPDEKGKPVTSGELVEWPVLAIGRRIMFDDVKAGTVYTTSIISGYTDRP